MIEYFKQVVELIRSTGVPEQLKNVDYLGLLQNPWFIIPVVITLLYLLVKKEFNIIIIIAICVGVWIFSGTNYMNTLIVGGTIQIGKILPVVFGGAVILIVVIYLLINRD